MIDAIWFNTIGIVRTTNPNGQHPVYYIGIGEGLDEEKDKQFISDWGSKFDSMAGDLLFGQLGALTYDGKWFYGNQESLDFVRGLIEEKEATQVRKSARIF